jgi:hypothetical protein
VPAGTTKAATSTPTPIAVASLNFIAPSQYLRLFSRVSGIGLAASDRDFADT